jgi:excisionase family DNA binding protein
LETASVSQRKALAVNAAARQTAVIPEGEFQKRTYTVEEIQNILGISRSSAYNFVKKGYFRIVRVGGSIRISKKSFDSWLDEWLEAKP